MDKFFSNIHSARRGVPEHSDSTSELECKECGLDPVCAVLDYAEESSGIPEGILLRRRPVRRGETLFCQGDRFHSIYAVKSGSFKTLMLHPGRANQVIGFQFPGELIGVEALSLNSYSCSARALQQSSVCELSIARLPESGRPPAVLYASIIKLLGREVTFNHQLIASLVHQSAEQRLCGFLLSLSKRLAQRGFSGREFTLTMSRTDIGSYLGLASETVSRVLTRLDRSGAIRLRRKRILVLDRIALQEMVSGKD